MLALVWTFCRPMPHISLSNIYSHGYKIGLLDPETAKQDKHPIPFHYSPSRPPIIHFSGYS